MDYTLDERGKKIIEECLSIDSKNPIDIFKSIASKDYIRIHGPEHHILDGTGPLTTDETWGLDDPTGKSDEEFVIVIKEIEKRILELKEELCVEKTEKSQRKSK